MHNLKQQNGMATILVVLLIGMTVMLLTAAVARTLVSKKEAGVAVHAQTNAELMGWAGVSAFREYLLVQGNLGVSDLLALNGVAEIDLKPDPTLKKQIFAKNIRVRGCTAEGAECVVSADVSAVNNTSQAATTIHAIYSLALKGGTTTVVDQELKASFGGDLTLAGGTISAEQANSKVAINVDGDITINTNFSTNNISELTLNSTGNVKINCAVATCNNININAKGYIWIMSGGNFKDLYAQDYIKLELNTKAQNLYSLGSTELWSGASAQNINAVGNVKVQEASVKKVSGVGGNIYSNGEVYLRNSTIEGNVSAQGKIEMFVSADVNGNMESARHVYISDSDVRGDVRVYDYVDMIAGAKVHGSVYAKGINTVGSSNTVRLSTSWIGGNVYALGHLRLVDGIVGESVRGNVYLTGTVKTSKLPIKGSTSENRSSVVETNFTVSPQVSGSAIQQHIDDQMGFGTRVDVTKYKNEANYIFVSTHGFGRVILNKLKHPSSGATYIYEDGVQKVMTTGTTTAQIVGDGNGFFIGDYDLKDSTGWLPTTGAICQTLNNRTCSSNIVGYLPRLHVKRVGIVSEDYSFAAPTWYLRSTSGNSALDNAAFAPGIFYFDNAVNIVGIANGSADSTSSAFTNTILAEGSIDAMALSPRIYSPYAILREGHPAIICDRSLKTVGGAALTSTTPTTLSSKYLIPTNLCKNENEFAYNMDRDTNTGQKLKVNIDGTNVDKLDLGYVALMSNKIIKVGTCSRIYGDVYARDTVQLSASCGVTSSSQAILGNIATQGNNEGIGNTFGAGTNYIVPKSEYSNVKGPTTTVVNTPLKAESSTLKWAKYQ